MTSLSLSSATKSMTLKVRKKKTSLIEISRTAKIEIFYQKAVDLERFYLQHINAGLQGLICRESLYFESDEA